MPLSSRLEIAILGPGKIGSIFAFQLARTGQHDVTVIARAGSTRLEQLRRDGGIVDVTGARAEVVVRDSLDEEMLNDLVIVTVFDHQIDAVLPALTRSAAKRVLLMFNTFRAEALRDAVGVGRCGCGMPFVRGLIGDDGRLKAIIDGRQKTLLGDPDAVALFNGARIPAVLEPRMPLWLHCHVPTWLGTSLSPLS